MDWFMDEISSQKNYADFIVITRLLDRQWFCGLTAVATLADT